MRLEIFCISMRVRVRAVAAWPGGPGGAPTHLPLYDVGRHGHRRAPGVRSMYYQALALDQSSDVIVINLD